MENGNKCACKMCSCAVENNEKYCSDHCKDVCDQDMDEISCDCGHSGCR